MKTETTTDFYLSEVDNDTPQIWVGCAAAYDEGMLYGVWISAIKDVELLENEITNMLTTSPVPNAEKWLILDYSGFYEAEEFFGSHGRSLLLKPKLDDIVAAARLINEYGRIAAMLIAHFKDISLSESLLANQEIAKYESLADFAEQFVRGNWDIPGVCDYYIDWEHMAQDMFSNGEINCFEISPREVWVYYFE